MPEAVFAVLSLCGVPMDTSVLNNVIDIKDLSKRMDQAGHRLAACLKHIEASLEELESYQDLKGVESAIQILTSLQKSLTDELDAYL